MRSIVLFNFHSQDDVAYVVFYKMHWLQSILQKRFWCVYCIFLLKTHTHTILPNIMNDGYYSHSLTICDNIWNVVFPALSFQNPVAFVAQLTSNKKEIVVSPKSHSKSAVWSFFQTRYIQPCRLLVPTTY